MLISTSASNTHMCVY